MKRKKYISNFKKNPENRKTNFKKNISSSFKRIKKTPYDIKIHPPIWKKTLKKISIIKENPKKIATSI